MILPKGTIIYLSPVLHAWSEATVDGWPIRQVTGSQANGYTMFYLEYEKFKEEFPDLEPLRMEVLQERRVRD